jgi:hypothetical protein
MIMKRILIIFGITCVMASCGSDEKGVNDKTAGSDNSAPFAPPPSAADPATLTTVAWLDSTSIDLGRIKEGQVVEARFHFKNTGDKNLVIERVSASCGCTVPETPEKPIPPGGEDVIKAKFDSRGKPGEQHKEVYVTANIAEGTQTLRFKVEVTKG